ncbi:MAG: S26 family signal peptidase [Candidatus Omnitrophica bacterium]|nr:S26 family signal peptidase [Candidatus Omnitrophota bacterium]
MKVDERPHRDAYAAACLPAEIAQYGMARGYLEPGNCSTGTVLVLKQVKGMPGDHYVLQHGFLELNGRLYRIMSKDSLKRPLRIFYNQREGIINKNRYFLLSDFKDNSWDSRYWGEVGVQFLLKPVWLFEDRW